MRTIIFGHRKTEIEDFARAHGLTLVEDNPDIVISYGGDGTLILSEFHYPGVPKLLLKSSKICKLCEPFTNEEVLGRFIDGHYTKENLAKLDISAKGTTLHAVNDVIVHNADPRHAVRYRVTINGEEMDHEVIGDGVVVATAFGSSGYYRSITGSIFTTGIGLAFNNSTEQSNHIVLNEHDVIKLTITRGPARAYADNQETYIDLIEGDEVEIKKSRHSAHLIRVGKKK